MRLHTKHYVTAMVFGTALAVFTSGAAAQGRGDDRNRPGDDRNRPSDDRNQQRGNDRGHDNDKRDDKSDYHFRQEDRDHFSRHYQGQVKQWQQHPDRRHHVRAGDHLPSDYRSRMKSVPSSYYRDIPPPPPGYRLGYYDGYVVAYNPTTQIIADVLDLVGAAVNH